MKKEFCCVGTEWRGGRNITVERLVINVCLSQLILRQHRKALVGGLLSVCYSLLETLTVKTLCLSHAKCVEKVDCSNNNENRVILSTVNRENKPECLAVSGFFSNKEMYVVGSKSFRHDQLFNLFKAQRFLYVPPGLTFKNSKWCSLCVECFVRISEQTANFAVDSIN